MPMCPLCPATWRPHRLWSAQGILPSMMSLSWGGRRHLLSAHPPNSPLQVSVLPYFVGKISLSLDLSSFKSKATMSATPTQSWVLDTVDRCWMVQQILYAVHRVALGSMREVGYHV